MRGLPKIPNKEARSYVQRREKFSNVNHTMFAVWYKYKDVPHYVVYSYGESWPLFVWCNGFWYENTTKYSTTTSRHRTQAHPQCETVKLPLDQIQTLAWGGISDLIRDKLQGEYNATVRHP
jgi:hypothetical protein